MYYVKSMTRSSGGSAKGTPDQAIDYITDGHDIRRDPGYADAELVYIARLGEGWKTDLEGGRVPPVGCGILRDVSDDVELRQRFNDACQPWHDRRGTTGYKSYTFTLPKEVSLYAEGHREQAKATMYAAVHTTLERAFPGKDIAAVAAIHTRNEDGEIHYHVHVLVGKFARDRSSGRIFSLNSKAGGNTGGRLRDLKVAWKESVDAELRGRLGLRIEQGRSYARPALLLPDGTHVPPLNRESRRLVDKYLCPAYTDTTPSGAAVRKVLELNDKMDAHIFEVASGNGGGGWDARAFVELVPAEAKRLVSYEKRVATFKKAGYLTPDGKITPAFRMHFCARHGIDTPELQRIRADLANQAARASRRIGRPVPVPDVLAAVDRYEAVRKRVERLGFSRDDLKRIQDEARKRRPTPENLRAIRKRAEAQVLRGRARLTKLPHTKTIIRAYWDVQKARVRSIYLVTSGLVRLRYREHKQMAAAVTRAAKADLFYAKERRLAEIGRVFRPMFWATRIVLPVETRRLEQALARCAGLAASQAAIAEWKQRFVETPRQELFAKARALELPNQAQKLPEVERARSRIQRRDADRSESHFKRGCTVLRAEGVDVGSLARWIGRERDLVDNVVAVAKGERDRLPVLEYQLAVRAGRIGYLLEREETAVPLAVPRRFVAFKDDLIRIAARLEALDVPNPFPSKALFEISPREMEEVVTTFRTAGLCDAGTAWMQRAAAARKVSADVTAAFTAQTRRKEMER